jgi:hypothetical protein
MMRQSGPPTDVMKLFRFPWSRVPDDEYIARLRRSIALWDRWRLRLLLLHVALLAAAIWVFTNAIQAIGEVQKLPDAGQNAIAAIILEELADDRRWDDAFARSQDQLGRLANRVREDIRAGRVKDVGIDKL